MIKEIEEINREIDAEHKKRIAFLSALNIIGGK